MKACFKALILFSLILPAPMFAAAQQPAQEPPSSASLVQDQAPNPPPAQAATAKLKGDAPKAKLAQPFVLTFDVPLPAGAKAQDLALDKEDFNNSDFTVLNTTYSQTGESVEYIMEVMPFNIGSVKFHAVWKIPGFTGEIRSEEVPLEISKALTGIRGPDIVDIRGPYKPFDFWFWIKVAIVLLIVLYIFLRVKKYIKIKKEDTYTMPEPKTKDTRPLELIAKDKVEQVLRSGLWDKAEYKQFYNSLTDILRWYIEERYGIDAQVQTSWELLRTLRAGKAREIFAPVRDFLNSADLVKFAKQTPLTVDRDEDVRLINEIIETSTPKLSAKEEGGKK